MNPHKEESSKEGKEYTLNDPHEMPRHVNPVKAGVSDGAFNMVMLKSSVDCWFI